MKLTILVDNNVLPSKNLLGEHGLSFYIEADDKKILFDTGYSDIFLKNAQKMGIDLLDLDYIVLSHGHYDHTWGLSHYLPFYMSAIKQDRNVKKPTIVTHPDTFKSKFDEKLGEIGCLISEETLSKNFNVELSKGPFKLTQNLIFLGKIARLNAFEGKEPIGNDYIEEDSALAFDSDSGIVVITGCSHSGICNIVEYAKLVCDNPSITDIIGGFHLVNPPEQKIFRIADYLSKLGTKGIHPCHCTDFRSKMILSKYTKLEATGVGLVKEY
ncbi:MAG TPA: MBL fold metallo-hydrolase [Candidatus Gastranaerophilales bacterium]|nr:MBL fold metallo-hydrolase [Candidatus Gastranaerophilales bacterium]